MQGGGGGVGGLRRTNAPLHGQCHAQPQQPTLPAVRARRHSAHDRALPAQVRRIAEDCMRNFHPIYHIKTLMIRRELEKDESLRNENWERFLPNFKKTNPKKKQKGAGAAAGGVAAGAAGAAASGAAGEGGVAAGKVAKKKKPYTPFPPVQPPRKIDTQLESGEYFLSEAEKEARKRAARSKKQREVVAQRHKEREARFEPPKEGGEGKGKEAAGASKKGAPQAESLAQLGEKLKARAAGGGSGEGRRGADRPAQRPGGGGSGAAAEGAVADYLSGSARKRLRAAE